METLYAHIYVHMRTTVEIPDDVFRTAKRAAAERGCTLRELVTGALRNELASRGFSSRRVRRDLPSIAVPLDAPILRLSPEEMSAADLAADVEHLHGKGFRRLPLSRLKILGE